ncbi:C6 zinc finger domain-containing protein [Colletotrichum orchidophilum]|uniref:C6 zinc finger domain-containing protein n=1 Tax=Colletotrichum orchidophilum TaxID=1209926 RepID=A0A1G4BQR7_9PEZI|nr:C6 zinc finger domain-containing protein [Colletotrichum orchidophilum]OHF03782.1 C6 zinc finger domain-containing protein [Colletotrichum orchidophilum]
MVLLPPLKWRSPAPTNEDSVSNEGTNSDRSVTKVIRKRAKHTRTRLGCGICRFRHVRCGMERPSCIRCSSTGRVCDYITDASNERRNSLTANYAYVAITPRPNPNDAIYHLNPQTGRSINFYQGHSAPEFAGYFDVEFWSTTILQLSYREPCVHQMLVAIGSLHEYLKSGSVVHSNTSGVNLCKHAEADYTKAVGLLNTHMNHKGWSALEVTLVCSILCIMFEWLRGGYQDAVRHLTSSFKILATWISHKEPSSDSTSFGSPGGHLIRSQIKPIFHILVLQSRMLPVPPSVPPKLDLLTYVLVASPRSARNKGETYQAVAEPLSHWSDNFALFVSQQPHLASDPRVKILKVWRTITELISLSSFSSEERSSHGLAIQLSAFLDEFEDGKISLDIGVVALFYYTAAYCRHADTHRRAMSLLKSVGGPWGSQVANRAQQEYARIEGNNSGPSVYQASLSTK